MILAASDFDPPMHLPQWLACAAFVMWITLLAWKLVEKFRGPQPQPPSGELHLRVSRLEEEMALIESKMTDGFNLLRQAIETRNKEGEDRASKIHTRIDPIAENTGEIKGQLVAFTESFRNFATIISELARGNRI